MRFAGLLTLLALFALPACRSTPAVTSDNYADWTSAILPSAAERTWMQIPWIPAYADGVAVAAEQDRPPLVWVMNGHPLGCT